jgi:hypothetical protein
MRQALDRLIEKLFLIFDTVRHLVALRMIAVLVFGAVILGWLILTTLLSEPPHI